MSKNKIKLSTLLKEEEQISDTEILAKSSIATIADAIILEFPELKSKELKLKYAISSALIDLVSKI
jgi:hypothetical protein